MRNEKLERELKFAEISLKSTIHLAVAGLIKKEEIAEWTRKIYTDLYSLIVISEAEIIQTKLNEVKIETQTSEKGKGNKVVAIEPPKPVPTSSPSKGEVPTSKELLFAWIKTHKKLTSDGGVLSFIKNVLKIDPDRLDTDVPGVYKEIKELTNWN